MFIKRHTFVVFTCIYIFIKAYCMEFQCKPTGDQSVSEETADGARNVLHLP